MIKLRASLITWFGLSLGIAGLTPFGFAEETPMVTESFRSWGDHSIFERLKAGQKRICFSIRNGDLCYQKVQTRTFVKAYTDWRGRGKEKEKHVKQEENVFRCPAPACDHTLSFGEYDPREVTYSNIVDEWGEVLKHLMNEHGWYLSTVALPCGGTGYSGWVRHVHCIDTEGPSGAHLPEMALAAP